MAQRKAIFNDGRRVALYLRVSTGPQAKSDLSIPDQRKAMTRHCEEQNWRVVQEFVDAKSGRTEHRPEYQRMMDIAKTKPRQFDVVMVHSFSRFFRDAYEFEFALRELRRNSIDVVSLTQEIEDSPTGNMIRAIINLFDQYTSEETSKHVMRTMRESAKQGFHVGGKTPFGYELFCVEKRGHRYKKKLRINTSEAEVVRRIYDLYRYGDGRSGPIGTKRIAEWLNDHGTYKRSGNAWSNGEVHRVLTDSVYVGTYVFGKKTSEPVNIPTPAIIEMSVFEEIGRGLKSRDPKVTPPRTITSPVLLSGLTKCPHCSAALTATTGKGGRYQYYSCSTHNKKGPGSCTGFRARRDAIDDLVVKTVVDRVLNPSFFADIFSAIGAKEQKSQFRSDEKLAKLSQELQEAEERLRRLYLAVEMGVFDLGSGLIDHIQKMTIAAITMADMKVWAQRS